MSSCFKRDTFIVQTDGQVVQLHSFTHTHTRIYFTHTHPYIHIHYTHAPVHTHTLHTRACMTRACIHAHMHNTHAHAMLALAYVHTDIHTRTPQEQENYFSITFSKAVHFYRSQTKLREDNVLHRSVSHSVHKGDVYPSMQWAEGVHP